LYKLLIKHEIKKLTILIRRSERILV